MRLNKRIIASVFVMAFLGIAHAQQNEAPTSKPIAFEGIDIELGAEQATGKMLLLCFWDVQQRPSRNLVTQLAGRQKDLRSKGVIVLLVQTSDVGADALKSWIDKNKIPFICGRIAKDTPKVLYRWGVKGQPWLVLTDEKSAVRAGGFEIEQLDQILLKGILDEASDARADEIGGKMILKLVDSEGLPVGGAKVGANVRSMDSSLLNSRLNWSLRDEDRNMSSEHGEITLTIAKLFPPSWPVERKMGLYILHEERRIGAVCEVAKDDTRQVIELKLEPVCHVHGKLDSEGLKKVNRPLRWTNVYMYWNRDSHGVMSHMSEKQRFEFFAPPGKYELMAYGSGEGTSTKHVNPKVEVKPGQTELDLGVIDLPATKVSSLVGKPAPELGTIKAWKNGSPAKLSELKGKAIIIYFDGDSPNTSRDLPRLVELHEDFEKQGLVIIALYNAPSMEDLLKKWAEVYAKYGGEPDVPFRVAVDGGEPSFYEGTDRIRLGATYATYDITSDPTGILIDTEGKISGDLNLYDAKKKLETILGVTVEPNLATWRQRFNKVYFLEDGRVLKRIPPPFIPERQEYYKSEHSHQASLIARGPDYFTFHWDGELKNWGMGFGNGKRPLRSVLNGNLGIKQNEYEGPKELLDVEVPGDWIVRKDASQEQKLKALEGILASEISRTVRFVKRTVERKAIIATGSFQFSRLPTAQKDQGVLMFCGDFVEEDGGGGGTADSVYELLAAIGNHVNMPVIDQTESAESVRIPYRHYRSSYLSRIEDPVEKEQKVSQLLDNISRQTNLHFRVELRPIEKWFVTE